MTQTTTLRNTVLESLRNTESAQFCYLRYRNDSNELSTYKLLLNVNFMNMYKDDLETLQNMNLTDSKELKARNELITSVQKAIDTEFQHAQSPTKNMYSVSKAIKFHEEKNEMYLHCVSLEKKVIEPGTYKVVNSSEATIIKNRIKKNLKQSKIRFFRLNLEQIEKISVNKNRIIIVSK